MTKQRKIPAPESGRYQPQLGASLDAYQDAVVKLNNLDPITTELVRLRCGRQHDCHT
ncbi:MAG TPA: hypothetical protein QGF35_08060 [Dehalococcoidia bacterium]|nr:hypothetical protein [Dehalococcoidia bacterium]